MSSNSNINNKVTFWNNYSFTNDVTKDIIPIIDASKNAKIDNNGIYFNNDLNVPHIMYNGYVFTAGSYVSGTSTNVTGNAYNIITSMSANTFSREISYNYTTIDLSDIYRRLTDIETELRRETKTDTLTITPNSYNIYAGDTYNNFKWQTETGKTPYFTGTDKKPSHTIENFGTLTINDNNTISFVSVVLPTENDNSRKEEISLTSYSGIYNEINYTSDIKTISITVSKREQNPTISTIPTIYKGNSPITVTVGNIKDNAKLSVSGYDTSILDVSVTNNTISIEGKKGGSTNLKIIISSTGRYKNYEITKSVKVEVKVTAVSVKPSSITLTEGGTKQLEAEFSPIDATNQKVTWSSNKTGVAKVSDTGLVTAVSAGTATITVTTEDGNKTATCSVTVNAAQVINYYWYVGTVNPSNMTPPSVGDANATLCEWTLLSAKPTEIAVYKTDENWDEHTWYIAIPEEYGYSIYDNGNNNITNITFTKTTSTIANVKYAIYTTTFKMDTIDVKVKQ